MMPFGQGGAMIGEVVEGGPAAEAGLMAGDLIVAVDGQELSDDVDFAELIGSYAPGDVVTLTVTNIESNETLEVPVTLGAHPDDEERAFLGISYALAPSFPDMGDVAPDEDTCRKTMTPTWTSDEAIEDSDEGGAMIADVLAGGPADEAGLVAGDLIVAVDGEELSDDVDFAELIGAYAPGDEVTLTVTNARSPTRRWKSPSCWAPIPKMKSAAFLGIAYVLAPAMPGMGDLAPSEDADSEDADNSDDDADMGEDDDGDLRRIEDADEDAAPRSRYYRFTMPSGPNGAKIAEVVSDSPAADAGLVAGDLIVAVDGEELSASANLGDLIGAYAPGDEVKLTIQHRGSDEIGGSDGDVGRPSRQCRAGLPGRCLYADSEPALGSQQSTLSNARQCPENQRNEDGDGCFHGHEGCEGDHGYGEHGDMMPFFHHGFENFDLDQLSEEDRDVLQEMFPFLFPDVEPESESQGEGGL